LIVQTQANGQLAMVQAVAQRGRLVAQHACLRLREGVGGGAALKESVAMPEICCSPNSSRRSTGMAGCRWT
jgi:hypothetical protein